MADPITGTDWADREVDLIVADYFDMLSLELAGRPFVKAHRNAALQQLLGRSHASIEFKHCNITAVLEILGMPTIRGYKKRANFQRSLIDGIARFLSRHTEIASTATFVRPAIAENAELWIEAPPSLTSHDVGDQPESLRCLVRKFDPAARDARNRKLGRLGESLVLEHEQRRLILNGRDDLASKIRWVSEEDGDGAGYDIHSFEPDGRERLIEVKTTNGHAQTPFFISANERAFSEERPDAFRLLRVYDFVREPCAFEIQPPLENWVKLSTTSYRAGF